MSIHFKLSAAAGEADFMKFLLTPALRSAVFAWMKWKISYSLMKLLRL